MNTAGGVGHPNEAPPKCPSRFLQHVAERCPSVKIATFKTPKPVLLKELVPHMLHTAINVYQLHFSSNLNKKAAHTVN